MPTYLYECPIHGEFECIHSITEELKCCPICEKETPQTDAQPVKRLIIGGSGFILNGGGWAKDSYS